MVIAVWGRQGEAHLSCKWGQSQGVKEDAVTNILDQLRGKKTWSREKELM